MLKSIAIHAKRWVVWGGETIKVCRRSSEVKQKVALGNERARARSPLDGIANVIAIKNIFAAKRFSNQKACSASRGTPAEIATATKAQIHPNRTNGQLETTKSSSSSG